VAYPTNYFYRRGEYKITGMMPHPRRKKGRAQKHVFTGVGGVVNRSQSPKIGEVNLLRGLPARNGFYGDGNGGKNGGWEGFKKEATTHRYGVGKNRSVEKRWSDLCNARCGTRTTKKRRKVLVSQWKFQLGRRAKRGEILFGEKG